MLLLVTLDLGLCILLVRVAFGLFSDNAFGDLFLNSSLHARYGLM